MIKASRYFAVEGDDSLSEKLLIFYVLVGVKPASEVGSVHTEWLSPTYGESQGDDQDGVVALLERLGLRHDFRLPYEGTVTVALRQEFIDEHHRIAALAADLQARIRTDTDDISSRDAEASLYRAYGELYGYPRTAIDAVVAEWAYDQPALMTIEEQQRVGANSGLPDEALIFRFSAEHWQDELATIDGWYALARACGMDTPVGVPKPAPTLPT